jgi:hypothetical protein
MSEIVQRQGLPRQQGCAYPIADLIDVRQMWQSYFRFWNPHSGNSRGDCGRFRKIDPNAG